MPAIDYVIVEVALMCILSPLMLWYLYRGHDADERRGFEPIMPPKKE